jgi:hypothetical protein
MQVFRWIVAIAVVGLLAVTTWAMIVTDDPRGREVAPWFIIALAIPAVLAVRWAWASRHE